MSKSEEANNTQLKGSFRKKRRLVITRGGGGGGGGGAGLEKCYPCTDGKAISL